MTHPYREELAGRLELMADERPGKAATLREAAAALRQSPNVEEVAELAAASLDLDNALLDMRDAFVRDGVYSGPKGAAIKAMNRAITRGRNARRAQAIADLYGRGG